MKDIIAVPIGRDNYYVAVEDPGTDKVRGVWNTIGTVGACKKGLGGGMK